MHIPGAVSSGALLMGDMFNDANPGSMDIGLWMRR